MTKVTVYGTVRRQSVDENCERQIRQRGCLRLRGCHCQENACVETKLRIDEVGCDIKRQDPNVR